LKDH
jgi:hypothetical protein